MFSLWKQKRNQALVVGLLKKGEEAPCRRSKEDKGPFCSIRDFLVAELPEWMVLSGCLETSENKKGIWEAMSQCCKALADSGAPSIDTHSCTVSMSVEFGGPQLRSLLGQGTRLSADMSCEHWNRSSYGYLQLGVPEISFQWRNVPF